MEFEIDFKEFNLGDVLQFLARVKKTGVLKIKGKIDGEIYIRDGLVIHAKDQNQKGMEALFNLSSAELDKGSFEAGVVAPENTVSLDVGKLAEDIEKRRIEFEEIKKKLPPLDAVFAKSPKELDSAVALRRTDWQILALVNGKRRLDEVINESRIGGYEATKIIIWLKEQGLIYEPKEAERIMSGLIFYLETLFKDFGKNGLVMLKRWGDLGDENREVIKVLNIDGERLQVKAQVALAPPQIEAFFKSFEEYFQNEGPKVYGKLLFKNKFEAFKQKVEKGQA